MNLTPRTLGVVVATVVGETTDVEPGVGVGAVAGPPQALLPLPCSSLFLRHGGPVLALLVLGVARPALLAEVAVVRAGSPDSDGGGLHHPLHLGIGGRGPVRVGVRLPVPMPAVEPLSPAGSGS